MGEQGADGAATNVVRPALEPIAPVVQAEGQVPSGDTGLVGHPQIKQVAGEGEAAEFHSVAAGDTLSMIAARYDVAVGDIMSLNGMSDPNTLVIGQVLSIPTRVGLVAPFQRLLPDSELVLGPGYKSFDVRAFVAEQGGFLASYTENVEGEELDGAAIVERVSERYSVGPRPLLAMLEYASGWVTQPQPSELAYPMGVREPARAGLFFQLSWAANHLNEGYYGTYTGRDTQLEFKDGTRALFDPETNPGSAALQNVYAASGDPDAWAAALAEDGWFATYVRLFGDPWSHATPPPVPDDLTQPSFVLPWPSGETWYYTGGPHGGWGNLSGLASLDFVPPDNTGCAPSEYWATAAAAGKVIRSENGEVVVDLDGDGFVGTGWTLLYMHMGSAGRVAVGSDVKVGDPIGRPSCEGGFSDAAHLHIARRYNGQWIEADSAAPFDLGGWQAKGATQSYDGFLVRGSEQREACACRVDQDNGLFAP